MADFYTLLFRRLNIPVCRKWLADKVKEIPYPNSMYGLGMVLSMYNVQNRCVKLSDKKELQSVDKPCVVIYNGSFSIVNSATSEMVELLDSHKEVRNVQWSEFEEMWDGVVMLIKIDKNSREPDFEKHIADERKFRFKNLALMGCIALLLISVVILSPLRESLQWWVLLVINGMGGGVSYMLLQKQLNIPNRFADKLCGVVKESHCENVTNSDGADFLGLVKLSEIGTGFFAVNMMALLFFSTMLFPLAVIAACVLPFSFWSIWYQKYKAKSWCVLCLITLALMWLQAAVYFIGGTYMDVFAGEWVRGAALISGYGLAVILTNKMMGALEKWKEDKSGHSDYNYLKAQEAVISIYERMSQRFDTSVENCTSLTFGNPDAPRHITIFSNPYCGPCGMMHGRIKDFPGNNICISYVMSYFSDELSEVNRHIIAAYQQLGPEKTWDILTEWYEGGINQGISFFDRFNLDAKTCDVISEFNKHDKWRSDDRLFGTPTVIYNGHEIIMPYSVEDYAFMPARI